MNENKWKDLWNRRAVNIENNNSDEQSLLMELKRSNGFDVVGELNYEVVIKQYEQIKEMLFPHASGKDICEEELSVYEVGCGSGANLYLSIVPGGISNYTLKIHRISLLHKM